MSRPASEGQGGVSPSLPRRVVRRLRPATLTDAKVLGARLALVEVAAAENQALRPDLERVVTQIQAQIDDFRSGLSHDPIGDSGR